MRILIVAAGEGGVIGINNDLPWSNYPADMKHFRDTTLGQIVIMGRKTYESIPEKFRPLPNRANIVITTRDDFAAPGCAIWYDLNKELLEQLEQRHPGRDVYFIGGASIYNTALDNDLVDKVLLSEIPYSLPDADQHVDKTYIDLESIYRNFHAVNTTRLGEGDKEFSLIEFQKKTSSSS